MTHKLNAELFEWMNANPYLEIGRLKAEEAVMRRSTKWRLRDRLTERDIARMKMAFETGMATQALVERYGINAKGVRKLLRKYGASSNPKSADLRLWSQVDVQARKLRSAKKNCC